MDNLSQHKSAIAQLLRSSKRPQGFPIISPLPPEVMEELRRLPPPSPTQPLQFQPNRKQRRAMRHNQRPEA